MADLVTPTTKLEAVNWILQNALGFTPVNTLEGSVGLDTARVMTALENETRNVCRKRMWFSRRDATLTPADDTSYIVLPSNVLSISRPSDRCLVSYADLDWRESRPTMRQGKLYSVIRQSYEWPRAVTVEVIEAIPFDDLPEEAKSYVTVAAALATNQSTLKSESVKKDLEPQLALAWNALLNAEIDNSEYGFK